jgi:diguanylate cyclase (GGDEF)-like protein
MSGTDTSSLRARAASHELTSLDERLGLLLLVRVGLVTLILLAGLFASNVVAFTFSQAAPVSAAYLLIAAAGEWYRRSQWPGQMLVHRAILPLDAVYLAIMTTPSGGPRSPLVILFAVQLIAVTILGSERAGLRLALWDTFLFIVIPTLSLSSRIGELLGVKQVAVPPASETTLAILGFWAVAICTAVFSSVSERELRRSKEQITSLASMASELEGTDEEDQILAILLRTLVRSFGFKRGVLWCVRGSRPVGLALPAPDAMVGNVPVPPLARADRVAVLAWADREPQLVRRLGSEEEPVAAGLLPGAANIVVLPLQIEGNDLGIILLEYGGHALNARIPKRTLLLLSQFAGHASLVLRNARLLAERERLAAIDGLTGLANRREFDQVLAGEVNRSVRSLEPVSLVVFDLDHFKSVNDTRGHLAGDEVLRSIAAVMGGAVREMDLVARYGGEEFALILPRCDRDDAVRVVERITSASRQRADLDGVTLSAGVATLPLNANDAISLVAAADEALYESKRAGRDRYTVSSRRAKRIGPLGMYTG